MTETTHQGRVAPLDPPVPDAPPPHAQLIQMVMGHWVSQILYTAATLRLADHLADGPLSAEQLATPTVTHAPVAPPSAARARRPGRPHRGRRAPVRAHAAR
jgi:hypothetical protein